MAQNAHLRRSRSFLIPLISLWLLFICDYVHAQSSLKIYGQVIDKDGPVVNAAVELIGINACAYTNQQGYYYVYNIPPGEFYVRCRFNTLETISSHKLIIESNSPLRWDVFLGDGSLTVDPIYVEADAINSIKANGLQVKIYELDSKAKSSVDDLVREIPGLNLINSPATGETYISTGGVRPQGVNVLIDGHKLNSLLTGRADLSQLPIKAISKIEYYSPGATGPVADGGLGGTINFVTTGQPRDRNIEFSAGRGDFGKECYSLESNFRGRQLGELTGTWESEYIRNDYSCTDLFGRPVIRENAYANHKRYYSSYSNNLSGNFVNLSGFIYKGKNGVPGQITSPYPQAVSDKSTVSVRGKFSRQLGRKSEINSDLSYLERNTKYKDYGSWIPYDTFYREREISWSADSRYDITSWLGVNGLASYSNGLLDGHDYIRPDQSLGKRFRDVFKINCSLNPQYSISQFDISGGLSYSYIRVEHENYSSDAIGLTIVRHRPLKLGCSFSYAHTFRLPGLAELHWKEDVFVDGNPNLKPERSGAATTEIFSEFNLLGSWRMALQYKDIRYKDLIYWQRSRGIQYIPENISNSDFFGTVFTVSYKFIQDILRIDYTRELSIALNREKDPRHIQLYGNYITFQPLYINRLNLSVNYNSGYLNLEMYDSGESYFLEDNTKKLNPYTLVNLTSGYKLRIKDVITKFEIKIYNITDTKYELLEYQPMPPRNFYFDLSLGI